MFTFKPKKVFEKLNKMDRKQAYTIGAIAVVSIVALLMLISAMTSGENGSFEGMKARGYDLANMPFATDEAEKYLLANAYPDMRENGSTLLYSAEEKQARQEADEEAAEETEESSFEGDSAAENDSYASRDSGYGSYSGSGRGGRGGGSKTEIGQLGTANMAHSGGSGVNATYGPSGDFRQFKGRENRGNEAPVALKTNNARNALSQFRSGSLAAARIQQNKMANAGKALYGGNVAGSDAFGKDGVDLSKLQNGGFTLDTSAPPTSTDLDNLDKQVADAAKKAEEKKKEEAKRSWWEDMLINLAQQAAQSLVGAVMDGVGDSIKGAINGNAASRAARKQYGAQVAGSNYENLSAEDKAYLASVSKGQDEWNKMKPKERAKLMSHSTVAVTRGQEAKVEQIGKAQGSTDTARYFQQKKDDEGKVPDGQVRDSSGRLCDSGKLKDGKCP